MHVSANATCARSKSNDHRLNSVKILNNDNSAPNAGRWVREECPGLRRAALYMIRHDIVLQIVMKAQLRILLRRS